ncbi:MAG: extracellular solute-binding protein, partial [Oscillospiraceae bacterium]|nr:extracellular solute-binding protein [Oscillospiraceae bacterium]
GAPGETLAFENVYTETPLPIELTRVNHNGVKSAGDRVYFSGYKTAPPAELPPVEDGEGAEIPRDLLQYLSFQPAIPALISCKLDGSDTKTHWEPPPQSAVDGGVGEYTQLTAFDADADGNLWFAILTARSDDTDPADPIYENGLSIVKLAPDGTELFNTDLSSPAGGGLSELYVQAILHDSAGNVYLQAQDIHAFSADGKYAFTLRDASSYIQAMTATNEGEIIYLVQELTGASVSGVFKPIDFAAKAAGAALKYNGGGYLGSNVSIYPGSGEYTFYYLYQTGIYGMDRATMTGIKIVDFINSDISYDGTQSFAPIDGGGFIMMVQSSGRMDTTTAVSVLTEDKNASLEGKTVLTLGSFYSDVAAVMRFNKASRTARVIVRDYSEYNAGGDNTGGQTQFDMDVIGGRAPDIIALPGSAAKYAAKGALADLTPFLESGKHGVSRENLFENILSLGAKDGKVFQIMPRFYIMTLAGKQSIFGNRGGITAAELSEIADKYPNASIIQNMTAPNWLSYAMWLGMSNYIDWEAGTCSFDSQEFIDTLEFSRRFPQELGAGAPFDQSSYLEYQREMEGAYAEDRVLLYSNTTYRGSVRFAREMDVIFGEKTALVGYPAAGGGGGIVMSAGSGVYAISESSPSKDAAWEFICSVITYNDNNESSGGGRVMRFNDGGIALDKRLFDEQARAEMVPLEERDFTNPVYIMRPSSDGGASGRVFSSPGELDMTDPYFASYALTEDDVARAFRAITGANAMMSSDEQISKIVTEEAAAFFSGAKTAEETANVIQSRASLYVSESK